MEHTDNYIPSEFLIDILLDNSRIGDVYVFIEIFGELQKYLCQPKQRYKMPKKNIRVVKNRRYLKRSTPIYFYRTFNYYHTFDHTANGRYFFLYTKNGKEIVTTSKNFSVHDFDDLY